MSSLRKIFKTKLRDILTDFNKYLKKWSKKTKSPLEKCHVEYRFSTFQRRLDKIKCSTTSRDNYVHVLALKASLYVEDSYRLFKEGDYIFMKIQLENAMTIIREYAQHPLIYFLYLKTINYLSYCLINENKIFAAKDILESFTGKEIPPDVLVYTTDDLFISKNLNNARFDIIYEVIIGNLHFLSEIYYKLDLLDAAGVEQHIILNLELNLERFNQVNWARRCITLAGLYLKLNKFDHARYYLSASESALKRDVLYETGHPHMELVKAELARAWGHYGLKLFSCSRKYFLSRNKKYKRDEVLADDLKFNNFEVTIADIYTHLITTENEAFFLFKFAVLWLSTAQNFFTFNVFPFIYINCIYELSNVYHFMTFYEKNFDRKQNMIYIRANILKLLDLTITMSGINTPQHLKVRKASTEAHIDLMQLQLDKIKRLNISSFTRKPEEDESVGSFSETNLNFGEK